MDWHRHLTAMTFDAISSVDSHTCATAQRWIPVHAGAPINLATGRPLATRPSPPLAVGVAILAPYAKTERLYVGAKTASNRIAHHRLRPGSTPTPTPTPTATRHCYSYSHVGGPSTIPHTQAGSPHDSCPSAIDAFHTCALREDGSPLCSAHNEVSANLRHRTEKTSPPYAAVACIHVRYVKTDQHVRWGYDRCGNAVASIRREFQEKPSAAPGYT